MNDVIKQAFQNFMVNGKAIPVSFLNYSGSSLIYITYMEIDKDNSFSGDDELLGYVDYYDFDIYLKSGQGNLDVIIKEVKKVMKQSGFTWQPSRDSEDMYEADTGYFHKTLCFAIERDADTGEIVSA